MKTHGRRPNQLNTSVYRHYKGGTYSVLFHAMGSATNARCGAKDTANVVVYVSLTTGQIHVRDRSEFYGVVDGGKRRFEPVE